MIEFTFEQILTNLLLAARWTIVLSIVSFIAGGVVGFALLVMRVSKSRLLRTIVKAYVAYYTHSRTHLSLGKDSPLSRPVHQADDGVVIAIPEVGGLQHGEAGEVVHDFL